MRSWVLLCAILALTATAARADTPFQLAVPNLRVPDDPAVRGVRFSLIHGENQRMRGVDFGALSMSETDRMSGVAFIGGVHRLHGDMKGGVIFSILNVHSGHDTGMNHAFVNLLGDPDRALNVAFLNVSTGSTLVDLGGINVSETSTAQIGFINMAENGFLPNFPVFNFPVD